MGIRISQRRFVVALPLVAALHACGGGGSGTDDAFAPPAASFAVSGQAQKGPLMFGSWVWVSELDKDLNPTGKTYVSQITDHVGNFTVSSSVGSNVVQLVATGYYVDELTGSLSTAPVTLSAIADLRVDATPTINVLTTLQAPRIKALMRSGKNYEDANAQSQAEVLAAFGIDVAKITGMQSLYAMSINGSADQDSALLAATAVLSKMASNAALVSGSSQAAEISHLLGQMGSEIAGSGQITTGAITTARRTASTQLDLKAVRTNIEAYYARQGISLTAAKFEEWVDHDGSGVLPRRLLPVTGLAFADFVQIEANGTYTSAPATISGLPQGVAAPISVSAEATIVKNGTALAAGATASVVNGDTVAIRRVSPPGFGQSATSSITVGTTTATWKLTTRGMPAVSYAALETGAYYGPSYDLQAYAVPVKPAATMTVHYAGMLIPSDLSNPVASIAIHADTGGAPGAALATSTALRSYFDEAFLKAAGFGRSGDSVVTNPRLFAQASFGAGGVTLEANTLYWVVLRYPNVIPRPFPAARPAGTLPGVRITS
ncbi:MAG TPA: hypothetical protein VHL79_12830, partial [Ramlibacter sp.]|nr:hypothetical protein [Ramlibacter sp.]